MRKEAIVTRTGTNCGPDNLVDGPLTQLRERLILLRHGPNHLLTQPNCNCSGCTEDQLGVEALINAVSTEMAR